ncbi:viroplasmin family protein [Eubacterium xylanophilum]|uniref:ribonuclease H1 domain-containing protein n=1 Tax=Eubacterium xylanophilum TaxID=39497 RepID=UPI00047A3FB3|nr:ribonuclease H family protein [Eubacterium xylanophilum]
MAKKNYYCVLAGKTPGIYKTWNECKAQVDGFPGAKYKGFSLLEEAEEYMKSGGFDIGLAMKSPDMVNDNHDDDESEKTILTGESAVAYVDGSYDDLTGDYSCGIVFFYNGKTKEISLKGENQDLAEMRNVAGEIMGAKLAMEMAIEQGIGSLEIYYDYKGIEEWCLGRWKTNKAGTIAYKSYYDSIKDKLDVKFKKVKGHSGDKYNDLADKLAKEALGLI